MNRYIFNSLTVDKWKFCIKIVITDFVKKKIEKKNKLFRNECV